MLTTLVQVDRDTNDSCTGTYSQVDLSRPWEHVNELTKPVVLTLQPGDVQ